MTKAQKTRARRKKVPRCPAGGGKWEEIERDIQGLESMCLMQLRLIRNLENEVAQLRQRET